MKKFLASALTVAAALITPAAAMAQGDYPNKPIKFLIAFAPGGTSDTIGRLVATHLSKVLGQPVVPENRPGATGTIGTAAAAKADADGYTLLMASASSHYSAYLYPTVPYDIDKDFAPVANLAVLPLYVVARPDLPANNMGELAALAKKNPGKITYASPGSGGAAHLATELFKSATGADILHVPYKGVAAGLTDIMGGRVDLIFDSVATSEPYVKSGKLKALGIASAKRSSVVPNVPTISETVPGFEATYWMGIFAPAKTPPAIVDKLNAEINKFLASPEMRTRIAEIGGISEPGSPADFGRYLAEDKKKWIAVIKEKGISAQ